MLDSRATLEQFQNSKPLLLEGNKLGHEGVKDEGLWVRKSEGAEGKIKGNALAGDADSVAYDRTAEEILRIVYGSGDEHKPGGFYPKGGNGNIARSHLH
ncbi:desiccation-related protein pcc13-62 [Quercus suber]|uniref:Desiccation-related protein pcc13-62 n=1 Tax=Quercus suber TaxID=58331 RepID=A0AAW0IKK9_QUESU